MKKNIINECSFYLFLEKKDLKIYFKVQKESLKSVNSKQSYVAAKYEKVSFLVNGHLKFASIKRPSI